MVKNLRPTLVFLPGKSHGQRSPVGYSPWGCQRVSLGSSWHSGKESVCQCWKNGFDPWVWKFPWSRKWQPAPVFLPAKIPWTKDPGRLQSTGLQRVGHNWARTHTHTHTHTHTLNGEKFEAFPQRPGIKLKCPLLPLLFNMLLNILAKAIWQGKGRGEVGLVGERRTEKEKRYSN